MKLKIFQALICEAPRASAQGIFTFGTVFASMKAGFTLIEVLIALIILSIVVSVALESQITTIKIESAARVTESVCFEVDRILAEVCLGHTGTNISETTLPDCDIFMNYVQLEDPPSSRPLIVPGPRRADSASTDMIRWEIVPKNRTSLRTVVFTHPFQ